MNLTLIGGYYLIGYSIYLVFKIIIRLASLNKYLGYFFKKYKFTYSKLMALNDFVMAIICLTLGISLVKDFSLYNYLSQQTLKILITVLVLFISGTISIILLIGTYKEWPVFLKTHTWISWGKNITEKDYLTIKILNYIVGICGLLTSILFLRSVLGK